MSPILDPSNAPAARIAAAVMAVLIVAVLGYIATVLATSTGHPWRVAAISGGILACRLAHYGWKRLRTRSGHADVERRER